MIFVVDYYEDEKRPNEFVCVEVNVPGLRKKLFKREAANAEIDFDKRDK